jgi:hypothetical protein
MWTLASSLSGQFQNTGRQLYMETRQLLHALDSDEPQQQISIEQAQAWILLAIYELTCDDYHRGMMSAGKAFRLIQIMRLYELDANIPSIPLSLVCPERDRGQLYPAQSKDDWIDIETERRTFWFAYTIDRFTSMLDGLQMFFNEPMIRTRLPAPEANFANGRPLDMEFLADIMADLEWADNDLSSFTETIISATLCGRVLEHKQKRPAGARDSTYEFCRAHGSLNALLAQRIKVLLTHTSIECLDPSLTFTALAGRIAVLLLYDLVQSKPLGSEPQAAQLTRALHTEYQLQSMDAVSYIALLVATLGQHFQTHPLTPMILFLAARFSQSHPGLNDAYNKLVPCIMSTLQASTNHSRLAQSLLQLLTLDQP